MKRTRKTLSLVALLLVAVTLLSSCGVNYRKTDVSKYVTIGEAGYTGVTLETNKTIVTDRDMEEAIFSLRYENRTAKDKKDAPYFSGTIAQYDTLGLRLAIYDKDGKPVFSQFGLDSSKYNATGDTKGTVAAVSGLSFDVGYGEQGRTEVTLDSTNKITLPVDFLNGIEEMVYGENAKYTEIESFKIDERWKRDETTGEKTGTVNTTTDTPVKGFFSVGYTPSYAKAGSSEKVKGAEKAPVTVDTYLYEGKEQGKNDFSEAIYLGLLAYEKKLDAVGSKLTCGAYLTIDVVPVGTKLTDEELVLKNDSTNTDYTDHVLIEYDLNFEDTSKNEGYQKGTLSTTILFAYAQREDKGSETGYVEPITLTHTFGDDYEGTYKVGSNTVTMAGKTYTIRIFVEERVGYTVATTDAEVAELIKKDDHASHMTDLTGSDAEIISKYKAHLKEELQAKADKQADKDAKEALWQKVLSAAKDGEKSSSSFAKKYKKEEVEYLKYLYYDYSSSGDMVYYYKILYGETYEKFVVEYVNSGYESHYTELLETYLAAKDDKYLLPTGSGTDADYKAAYRQLESIFYKEGLAVARERALVYLLADKLGVRLSNDELEAKLDAAVKKANEDAKETIRDMVTVDEGELETDVKGELKNALLSLGISENTLKDMTVAQLAQHYLLQYYGVSSLDELPEKMVTRKSYLSQYDKESLFGGYQLAEVKNKLFENNKSTITFVEVDTDGNKLDKDTDGE